MKFRDRDNGEIIELSIIKGCNYWETKGGELYVVDRPRVICWPVNPAMALKHVLLRETLKREEWTEEEHLSAVERILSERKALEETRGK